MLLLVVRQIISSFSVISHFYVKSSKKQSPASSGASCLETDAPSETGGVGVKLLLRRGDIQCTLLSVVEMERTQFEIESQTVRHPQTQHGITLSQAIDLSNEILRAALSRSLGGEVEDQLNTPVDITVEESVRIVVTVRPSVASFSHELPESTTLTVAHRHMDEIVAIVILQCDTHNTLPSTRGCVVLIYITIYVFSQLTIIRSGSGVNYKNME